MFRFLEMGFLIGVVGSVVVAAAQVRKGPSELLALRISFLIAVAACFVLAGAFVDWTADVKVGDRHLSSELGTAPLWSPPPFPSYTTLTESWLGKNLHPPPADTPGLT